MRLFRWVIKTVNPHEAVAMDAAIQCGVLEGDFGDTVPLDVTSLSFGIEIMGDVFAGFRKLAPLLFYLSSPAFFLLPLPSKLRRRSKCPDERGLFRGSKLTSNFTVSGIPPASKGDPKLRSPLTLTQMISSWSRSLPRYKQKRFYNRRWFFQFVRP